MEVETAKKIINCIFEKSNKWNTKNTSYGLKHMVENYSKIHNLASIAYLSNDEFKNIMIEMGYERKEALSNPNNDIYKLKVLFDPNNYKAQYKLHNLELKLLNIDYKIQKHKLHNHYLEEKNKIIVKINEIKEKLFGKSII